MSEAFQMPFVPALDENGDTVPGAQLYFFLAGTTTPEPVYLDAEGETLAPHPVIANSSGRFPPLWSSGAKYKVVLRKASDIILDEIDNYAFTGISGSLIDGGVAAQLNKVRGISPDVGETIADGQIVRGLDNIDYRNTSGGDLPMPASFPADGFEPYHIRGETTVTGPPDATISSASFGPVGDTDHRVIMRTGPTTDGRSYIDWRAASGGNAWLMGRNAGNDFILFDANHTAHRLEFDEGSNTFISSAGTGAVIVNAHPDSASGTGGFIVASGGQGGSDILVATGTQIRLTRPTRIEDTLFHRPNTANGNTVNLEGVAGTDYTLVFGFQGDTNKWRMAIGSDGALRFRNGFGERMINLTDNDRMGIGADTFAPTAKLDVGGDIRARGGLISNDVVRLASYTVATLPPPVVGGFIFVSDAPGGADTAFSNGTNWFASSNKTAL